MLWLNARVFAQLRQRLERLLATMRSRPDSTHWNPLSMLFFHHEETENEGD